MTRQSCAVCEKMLVKDEAGCCVFCDATPEERREARVRGLR